MILWTVMFVICKKVTEGAFTITADKSTVNVGDNVTLTCASDLSLSDTVSWIAGRYEGETQTVCMQGSGKCTPASSSSDSRYTFISDEVNKRVFMTISGAESADSQILSCGYSSDRGQYELTITTPTTTTDKPDCDFTRCLVIIIISACFNLVFCVIGIKEFCKCLRARMPYSRLVGRQASNVEDKETGMSESKSFGGQACNLEDKASTSKDDEEKSSEKPATDMPPKEPESCTENEEEEEEEQQQQHHQQQQQQQQQLQQQEKQDGKVRLISRTEKEEKEKKTRKESEQAIERLPLGAEM